MWLEPTVGRASSCRPSKDAHKSLWPCFFPGPGPRNGVGLEWARAGRAARPSPQAILPLMKFLEVELCYMNTNLVQENFSRSAATACPAAPTPFPSLPPAPPSWPQHPFSGEDATRDRELTTSP